MRNKYSARCYRCGKTVAPTEGHFERVGESQRLKWDAPMLRGWLTQHVDCAIKYRGTAVHHIYQPEAP